MTTEKFKEPIVKPDTTDDDSLSSAVADGFRSAAYGLVQRPYQSIQQLAEKVHVNLPDMNMEAPTQARAGSARWVAQELGSAASMLPYLYASNKLARGVLGRVGAAESVAVTGLGIREAALTGAIYSAAFEPTTGDGNFVVNKLVNMGITSTTFGAGAAIHNVVRPLAGPLANRIASLGIGDSVSGRVASSSLAAISGFGAGVANAELNLAAGHPTEGALKTGLTFAMVGGTFGATSRFKPEEYQGRRVMDSKVEEAVRYTKEHYGESSPQHASSLVQLGDAYLKDGLPANAKAIASYEQALKGVSGDPAQTASIFDKLSFAKKQGGDYAGAAEAMNSAIETWNSKPGLVDKSFMERKKAELDHLRKVAEIKPNPS